MFGAVSSLFSSAALIGTIYALILQGRELKRQREESEQERKRAILAAEPFFTAASSSVSGGEKEIHFYNVGATINNLAVEAPVGVTAAVTPKTVFSNGQEGRLTLKASSGQTLLDTRLVFHYQNALRQPRTQTILIPSTGCDLVRVE